ncbi:ferredoxin [Frankia sp. Cppng1_Ct_nod]|uniref:ferredoxin n=1 Tax=Frankia sp. Cppng1_Ct_nod TaxID=2897162 RepID=UPI001040FD0E|nr:ferredoxin [Frankia sp. Cppng1_Ct_nod]
MRVTVDRDRCQGHALCVLNAPALFDLDEIDSHAYVLADPVPGELAGSARSAVENCPEQAIAVAD